MKKMLVWLKKIYNKETPLKIEWIVGITIAIIMLVTFFYIDLKSLTVWSTNIIDCVAKGDITKYYSYTALNQYGLFHQHVSGTLYSLMLWGIWNLPIWAIQFFGGKPIIESTLMLIWSKLFLVAALTITLITTYKICQKLFENKNKSKWITFLSATFLYTYIGVFYASQNDILICMFATLGLYYLLKGKNKFFYLFSALAISVKYFYFICYIPIILLTEKKISKIIGKLVLAFTPVLLFKFLVRGFPMYNMSETSNNSNSILNGLFNSGIKGSNGVTISFFILSFIIICFIAYMTNPNTKKMRDNYIFYFTVAPIVVMLMFSTYFEFYRPILLMPFLMILYGFKPKLFRINVILDTIMSWSCFISLCIRSKYLFNSAYSMKESVFAKILGIDSIKTVNLQTPIRSLLGENLSLAQSFITTVFFASLFILLVVNFPKFNGENKVEKEKPERWIIWMRSFMILPIIIYLIYSFISS